MMDVADIKYKVSNTLALQVLWLEKEVN